MTDKPRWRISCCNWGRDDAPHFAIWMPGEEFPRTHYTYTFAEAFAYINSISRQAAWLWLGREIR